MVNKYIKIYSTFSQKIKKKKKIEDSIRTHSARLKSFTQSRAKKK